MQRAVAASVCERSNWSRPIPPDGFRARGCEVGRWPFGGLDLRPGWQSPAVTDGAEVCRAHLEGPAVRLPATIPTGASARRCCPAPTRPTSQTPVPRASGVSQTAIATPHSFTTVTARFPSSKPRPAPSVGAGWERHRCIPEPPRERAQRQHVDAEPGRKRAAVPLSRGSRRCHQRAARRSASPQAPPPSRSPHAR